MGDADHRCAEVALRQHGVISRAQALRAGLSERAVARRLHSGEWDCVLPSVYRLAGAPVSWLQRLKAATLWAGGTAAVSHRSAAALWGLEGFPEGITEITALRSSSYQPPGFLLHRSSSLSSKETVVRQSIHVSRVERTLLDLCAVASREQVEAAMENALFRKLVTIPSLERCLSLRDRSGKRGAAVLRALLELRQQGAAPTESMLELRLLALLRKAGLPEPVRQFGVRSQGGFVARIDFAYPYRRLAIETDGAEYHLRRERWECDHHRRTALAALGWRCLVFTWSQLRDHPDRVVEQLRAALAV